jgi:hypothetical protein
VSESKTNLKNELSPKAVSRGARNSTEVRSEYSDMIYRSKKNESVELDEATFVSDSPATYGSRGAKEKC